MNDLSDDDIMQDLAMAAHHYKARFGEACLIDCLQNLIETIEAQYDEPVTVNPAITR
jgi:hypothetical protein